MNCRLGFVEYDGFQFCAEHLGWRHYTDRSMWCEVWRAPTRPPTDDPDAATARGESEASDG